MGGGVSFPYRMQPAEQQILQAFVKSKKLHWRAPENTTESLLLEFDGVCSQVDVDNESHVFNYPAPTGDNATTFHPPKEWDLTTSDGRGKAVECLMAILYQSTSIAIYKEDS